jgi:hypothetical protein
LLATHVALWESQPEYRDMMAKAGFGDEPEESSDAARRIGGITKVLDAEEAHDKDVDVSVRRFLGKASGPTPLDAKDSRPRKTRLEEFEKQAKALAEMAADPAKMVQASTAGDLAAYAPELAAASSMTVQRAAQFLQSKVPKSPRVEVAPALAKPWAPSDSELTKWSRYVRAVQNPNEILSSLRKGLIHKEGLEAIRAVYPELLTDAQQKVLGAVHAQTGGKPLSTGQRNALAVFTGAPIGDSVTPARFSVLQGTHTAAKNAEAKKQANMKMNTAANMSTQSQKVEGR